jgi:2-C-methyl-D-erythritol 4-phosphate cytidylyltransferase
MQSTALIIAAAGQGSRMGAQVNKQFIELEGKAILAHTLERFRAYDKIGQVILLHHADEADAMEVLVKGLELPFEVTFVVGGLSRQESVYNGLKALDKSIKTVMIHDGARPFITEAMHQRCRDFLVRLDKETALSGGFFGVPLKETVKQATASGFTTIDRSTLHTVQTPQLFSKEILLRAHEQALEEGFVGTDDCSLVERIGGHIEVLTGDYCNIKVTTPEDLVVGQALLSLF